jgi:hypothetical protein
MEEVREGRKALDVAADRCPLAVASRPILAATRTRTIDSSACIWLFAEGRGFYTGGAICCSGLPERPLGIDVGLFDSSERGEILDRGSKRGR